MTEFDFFSQAERSIAAAAIESDRDSPCRVREVVEQPYSSAAEPTLNFDNGAVVVRLGDADPLIVSAAMVFGRLPETNSVLGQPASCMKIDDDFMSREHVAIVVLEGLAYAVDLDSANGTTIRRGSSNLTLSAGVPTALKSGDQLEFGLQTMFVDGT